MRVTGNHPGSNADATTTHAARAQGDAATVALLAAARRLFADRGYGAVDALEIARHAGVPRAALAQFRGGKEDLLRAVLVQISAETMRRIVNAAGAHDDPWESLVAGIDEFLDACARPEVARTMLVDGPSVLGWDVWRAIDALSAVAIVEAALERTMDAGRMQRHPPDALAQVLLGALQEAANTIAGADDPSIARAEMGTMVRRLLQGFRTPGV